MAIKPSAGAEIRPLIAALSSSDEVRRETAIARLAIIGPRAVAHLLSAYRTADRDTRIAILKTLEALADGRALGVAREALLEGGDIAAAAAGLLRAVLDLGGDASPEALDALVETALAPGAERAVRLAALDALRGLPQDVRNRVAAALATDADASLQARGGELRAETDTGQAAWQDAIEGRLPEDPASLRDAVRKHAAATPLGVLRSLVDAVREREQTAPTPGRRESWLGVRGALHQALALRNSRIALYDLRETLGTAAGLPTSFVTAVHAVGDESCLEGVAAAWAGASDAAVRQQLATALHAIVKREKVTRRSSILKRIAAKYPGLFER